ncbi:D-glycero-beta-D-manno-heptose 1,7-bisphosphate 7-phosphatase [Arenicella sp. 4NH20-0111]|uniref:D-glycero-beta-D-manno-heptose 1,7-bisphosphate 7-phosphatase n=1 Tax=Arenicella sp. 4NH20-0111 TaxID=3127648 RepID=UPI003107D120
MGNQLVILDRDGVINRDSADFIKSPEELIPLKGSLEAIARLSQAGFEVVIITNQSGVGRGLFSADKLGQIHGRMIDLVRQQGGQIQTILYCPHHPEEGCTCRKPLSGMYSELGDRLGLSFKGVYSVGDSIRDLQAAKSAGATPVLVKTGNGRKSVKIIEKEAELDLGDTAVFDNLASFVDALLAKEI